jgi:hypothetical protein
MTDAAVETKSMETPHGVAILRDTCAACGQACVSHGAESFAEQWAHELHQNVCCGKAVACKDSWCVGHNPW